MMILDISDMKVRVLPLVMMPRLGSEHACVEIACDGTEGSEQRMLLGFMSERDSDSNSGAGIFECMVAQGGSKTMVDPPVLQGLSHAIELLVDGHCVGGSAGAPERLLCEDNAALFREENKVVCIDMYHTGSERWVGTLALSLEKQESRHEGSKDDLRERARAALRRHRDEMVQLRQGALSEVYYPLKSTACSNANVSVRALEALAEKAPDCIKSRVNYNFPGDAHIAALRASVYKGLCNDPLRSKASV